MRAIPIHNPSRNGKAFCSPKKAAYYIAHGRAVMRDDGTLQFTAVNQDAFNKRLDAELAAFDAAVAAGRRDVKVDEHGTPINVVWWNGSIPEGNFPPGCNVQIKRLPWRAARHQRRYSE